MKHAFNRRIAAALLAAAVVESPAGNLILQLFGDSATVARERDGFLAFVRSIAPAAP